MLAKLAKFCKQLLVLFRKGLEISIVCTYYPKLEESNSYSCLTVKYDFANGLQTVAKFCRDLIIAF